MELFKCERRNENIGPKTDQQNNDIQNVHHKKTQIKITDRPFKRRKNKKYIIF